MLALRTLEFWIDNLNMKFLYPIMNKENILHSLMKALTSLLKPSPVPYGETAMRVLGKLGGRNRKYLNKPLTQKITTNTTHGLNISFNWSNGNHNTTNSSTTSKTTTSNASDSQNKSLKEGTLEMNTFIELCTAFMNTHYIPKQLSTKITPTTESEQNKPTPAIPSTTSTSTTSTSTTSTTSTSTTSTTNSSTAASAASATSTPLSFAHNSSASIKRQCQASAYNVMYHMKEKESNQSFIKRTSNYVRSHYKLNAYQFLSSSLSLYIDQDTNPLQLYTLSTNATNKNNTKENVNDTTSKLKNVQERKSTPEKVQKLQKVKKVQKRSYKRNRNENNDNYTTASSSSCATTSTSFIMESEKETSKNSSLRSLLFGVLFACSDYDLHVEAMPYCKGMIEHLTMLAMYTQLKKESDEEEGGEGGESGESGGKGGETPKEKEKKANPLIMCDAVFDAMCDIHSVDIGLQALQWIVSTSLLICNHSVEER